MRTKFVIGVCGALVAAGCASGDDGSSSFPDPGATDPSYTQGEGLNGNVNHPGYCQPAATAPRVSPGACNPAAGDARGQVVSSHVLGLVDVSIEDTGDVHTSPGVSYSLVTASVTGVLSTGVVSSSASSSTSGADASATVAGLAAGVLGIGITADVVGTTAHAGCGTAEGATVITNLKIAGVHVDVTGAPNETIQVGGLLKVVLNEQQAITNGIIVRAIHVTALDGSVDLVVSMSSAATNASCCTTTDAGVPTGSDGGILPPIPDPFSDGGILPPIILFPDGGPLPPIFGDGGILPPIPDPFTDAGPLPPIIGDGGILPPLVGDGGILPPLVGDGGILPPPSYPDAGPPASDAGTPPKPPGTPCDDKHECGDDMICVPTHK